MSARPEPPASNGPPPDLPAFLEPEFDAIAAQDAATWEAAFAALSHRHPEHAAALTQRLQWLRAQVAFEQRVRRELPGAPDPTADGLEQIQPVPAPQRLDRLRARGTGAQDRYVLKGEVARGAMGIIMRAFDLDLGRTLAMKVILGQAEADATGKSPPVDRRVLDRFLEEAQVTSQLDHPGVVPVHELGLDAQGHVYFTMRLIKGVTADAAFALARRDKDGWTRTRALEVILKVCDTLAYAHSKGVVHRDLKPSNVMVGRFGEVYMMDWGLAKVLGQTDTRDLRIQPEETRSHLATDRSRDRESDPDSPLMTMDGAVVGTPSYMPPEQAKGQVEHIGVHSDVYAVGAMLYTLLTGRRPYLEPGVVASPYTILRWVQEGPPTPVHKIDPQVPPELVAICERAMARKVEARYADTAAMATEVRAYLDRRVVKSYRTGAVAELRAWVRRNRGAAAGIAAAVLAVLAGAAGTLVYAGRASEKATLAEAQRLAAESAAALAEDPTRALLLAIESGRRWPGPQANEALQSALRECRELRRLTGHTGAICDLGAVFSPDGKSVLTASRDRTARVFDIETGRCKLQLCNPAGPVYRALYNQDGSLIVMASFDGTVRLWDAASGQRRQIELPHSEPVFWIEFLGDASIVTSCLDDTVSVWDTSTGVLRKRLEDREGGLGWSLSLNHDGSLLVTTNEHGTGIVWDTTTWTKRCRIDLGHDVEMYNATFQPKGELILTRSSDHEAQLWNCRDGTFRTLRGHTDKIQVAAFSADGGRVVTGSNDRTVRIWDVETGKSIVLQGHNEWVVSGCFSPDGTRAITGSRDRTAIVWDTTTGAKLMVLRGHPEAVSVLFADEGRKAVTTSGTEAIVWDVRPLPGAMLGHSGTVLTARFSPDSKRLVTAGRDGETAIWDVESQTRLSTQRHPADPWSAAFRSDGQGLTSFAGDGFFRTWELGGADQTGGRLRTSLHAHPPALVGSFAFDKSSSLAVTGLTNGLVRVIDLVAGKDMVEWNAHLGNVREVAISPDGRKLASMGDDFSLKLWDVAPRRMLGHVRARRQLTAEFSPDGNRLVTTDGDQIVLWDGESLAHRTYRTLHQGRIRHVCFSPDGRWLLSVAEDWTGRVQDAATGAEVMILRGHLAPVLFGCFSPNGRWIATASEDRTARVWPMDPLELAKKRQPRELTIAERARYDLTTTEERLAMTQVDALFHEHFVLEEVLAQIDAVPALTPAAREPTEAIARQWTVPTHDEISAEAWAIVTFPGQSRERYERALQCSQAAAKLAPLAYGPYGQSLSAGVAQCRLGRFADAVGSLEGCRVGEPWYVIFRWTFLAKAYRQVGDNAKAMEVRQRVARMIAAASPEERPHLEEVAAEMDR